MNDDKDRQVCGQLKDFVQKSLKLEESEWEIDNIQFTDPGYTIRMVIYKGKALETFAYVTISYWPLEPKSRA